MKPETRDVGDFLVYIIDKQYNYVKRARDLLRILRERVRDIAPEIKEITRASPLHLKYVWTSRSR